MPSRYYMTYWRPELALEKLRTGEPLTQLIPNGSNKIKLGDKVWVCTVIRGRGLLYLLGCLTVGRIEQLPRVFGGLLISRGPVEPLKFISLNDIAQHIRFISHTNNDRLRLLPGGRVNPLQFSAPRRVTEETGHLLQDRWRADDVELPEAERDALLQLTDEDVPEEDELEQLFSDISEEEFGGRSSDYEERKEIEERAVQLVTETYELEGFKVISVEHLNCGYDLRCFQPRSPNEEQHVEVKGVKGSYESFEITSAEVRRAQEDPAFFLWLVTCALSKRPRLQCFTGEQLLENFTLTPTRYNAIRLKR